jgi:hypothetical protein
MTEAIRTTDRMLPCFWAAATLIGSIRRLTSAAARTGHYYLLLSDE